jgi:hypothetical protein
VAAPPPPTGTSTHRPATWARRRRLATARRAPFGVLLAAGLVAAACVPVIHLAFTDRWRDVDGILPEGLVRLTVVAVLALIVATTTAPASLVWALRAIGEAPVDDAEAYGGGRQVDLAWPDRYATAGRMTLEGCPDARVTATRDTAGARALPATVRVAGEPGVRVAAQRPRLAEMAAYDVTTDGGAIRVTGDEGPGGRIDWTLDDGRGTTLRWRHRLADRVPRVTLVDGHGTAWRVRRTSRTSVRAELPDELDPAAARALVLIVEDQLAHAARLRAALAAAGGGGGD